MKEPAARNISSAPQPRKPNHAIIVRAIRIISNPIASFLLIHADGGRGLMPEFRKPTGGLLIRFFTDSVQHQ